MGNSQLRNQEFTLFLENTNQQCLEFNIQYKCRQMTSEEEHGPIESKALDFFEIYFHKDWEIV